MFVMQTKPQVTPRVRPASGGKKETVEKRKITSHIDNDGVIQRVKFQYHRGTWNPIGDLGQGPSEVPEGIPAEEDAVYDTVTQEYVSPQEAHDRAVGVISAARRHQQQRKEIAKPTGQPLPPRNRSEMYSTAPMEDGAIAVETPFGTSTMKAGFFREKGGSRKQPLVVTPGVPRSYRDQARVMDQMPPQKRRSVFGIAERWASGTDEVEAPQDLMESMSAQEKKVASQLSVSIGMAEAHETRANPDGGKTSRAAFRMMQYYPVDDVLHPQRGADIIAHRGGNKEIREILSEEGMHTPKRETSFAPLYPFMSPISPSPVKPPALEEEREETLTDEEYTLWRPAAIKIEEYMANQAAPREREYFEQQIGLETIRQWIADPRRMTEEDLGKMMQFM